MSTKSLSTARKFWQVVPLVMSSVAAQARRGGRNLAPSHFHILRAISHHRCNLSELAERQGVSLPSMSDSVQTLVERGWLERKRSADDRRAVELLVTPKGQAVLEAEYRRFLGWMAQRLNRLAPKQLEKVEVGLDLLRTVFEGEPAAKDIPEKEAVR